MRLCIECHKREVPANRLLCDRCRDDGGHACLNQIARESLKRLSAQLDACRRAGIFTKIL